LTLLDLNAKMNLMVNQNCVTIGVLSDTHLPYRLTTLPAIIFDLFAGVDLILHAGDVDRIDLLQPLAEMAPLYAVRGNIHLGDFSLGGKDLPFDIHLNLISRRVVITHGHRRGVLGWLLKVPEVLQAARVKDGKKRLNRKIALRLSKLYPRADIIIFGHTHSPYCETIGRTLFFNPGAVVPSPNEWASVGVIRLWPDKIETEIIPL
jgi:putative phosphoesterase